MTNIRLAPHVMVGAALAMLVLTTAPPLSAQQSQAVAEGARVYGSTCGRCHNPRSPLERNDRDWVTIINHMRVRANLTGDQVRNVLAFLMATNNDPRERVQLTAIETPRPSPADVYTGPASTDAASIARGETLVQENACLGCHVIGGGGGQIGPSLNDILNRKDVGDVRRKLMDPTFDNSTSMMPNLGLTPDQIEAIVAYLATLGNDDR